MNKYFCREPPFWQIWEGPFNAYFIFFFFIYFFLLLLFLSADPDSLPGAPFRNIWFRFWFVLFFTIYLQMVD